MIESNCRLISSQLSSTQRVSKNQTSIIKSINSIEITFCLEDTFENFEKDLNKISGNSSFLFGIKKKFSAIFISLVSVLILLFGLLGASIYEDLFKRMIFELPFTWNMSDTISSLFVFVFFVGLVLMPSFLDPEGSDFKNVLSSWFNKDIKKLKRLKFALSCFDRKTEVNLYNFDAVTQNHWIWKLLVKTILNRFCIVNFYVRDDQIEEVKKNLKEYNILNISIQKQSMNKSDSNIDILLSSKEEKLYSLMHLSSSSLIKSKNKKVLVSLELFEYCGKNFLEENKSKNNQVVCGFQNFINRSFNDFYYLVHEKSMQIHFTQNVKRFKLDDERKKLAYYLRNHIEECISYFDNAISFLILYYYVKDIVLDIRRSVHILEKFIDTVHTRQQYELVDDYWFDIAGKMFDSKSIDSFINSNDSFYRKLSIKSLNKLCFLLERTGHYDQSLLINEYLYEINPNKYSLHICSLYERMGNFENAYESLPSSLEIGKNSKPNQIEMNYFKSKAWIVVSQRKKDLQQEGLTALKKFKELLFSHNEDKEPLWLWYYYNILANYDEWNENYESAIINYKKCLTIPALGAFEYGATFVNMSIAHRLMYLDREVLDLAYIDKSISLGSIGTVLKESVGDRDEMPVVLHNQALNILTKILFTTFDEKECSTILNITNDAISILDKSNSVKRLGMLLCENIISKALLKINNSSEIKRLERHFEFLDENESSQIINLYSQFIINDKIKSISFMDKLIPSKNT